MKMRLLSAAVLISAMPVFAQAGPGGPGGPGSFQHGGFGFGMRQPVTNAPYSATFTSTSTEKLQDGTTLTHTVTRVTSRDSLGRTREEITMPAHGTETEPHTSVVIFDPVTHTMTRLEPTKKIAIVHMMPAPRQREGRQGPPAPAGDEAAGNEARPRHEDKNVVMADLGSKTISGDVATGKKMTRTIPVGAMGNMAPIVSTHEEWMSSDLKIELSRNDVDAFHGTHTTAVTALTKAEPAATLFAVPPGYAVQAAPERAGRGHFGGPRRGDGPPPPPPSGM